MPPPSRNLKNAKADAPAHSTVTSPSGLAAITAVATLPACAISAMEPAAAAFGAADGTFIANDPAILLNVAARVELLASQVR